DQILSFLERGSLQPLSPALTANLTEWARNYRRVRIRRAVILEVDDPAERTPLLQTLRKGGWQAAPLGALAAIVSLTDSASAAEGHEGHDEEALVRALRAAGHAPRWLTSTAEESGIAIASAPSDGQMALPDDIP
ncbi:MAG: hypothetical protein ACRDJC_23250, partial [Thermomicrobiales bacterium]